MPHQLDIERKIKAFRTDLYLKQVRGKMGVWSMVIWEYCIWNIRN